MPTADVNLLELAQAIKDQLQEVEHLHGVVEIIDTLETDSEEDLRKGMGAGPYAGRISFPNAPMSSDPGMSSTMIFTFQLLVTVLYRQVGNAFTRVAGPMPALSGVIKDVLATLEGNRLDLLNQGGLSCGSVSLLSRGSSIQAMQFTVTARSRESRS